LIRLEAISFTDNMRTFFEYVELPRNKSGRVKLASPA
jgi:hypothetical protein